MKQRIWKMAGLSAAAASLAIAAGCSSSQPEKVTAVKSPAAVQEPVEISILSPTYGESTPNDIDRIKKLNEKLNIKVNVTFAPANNYQDKLNVVLASGDIPDVTVVWDTNITGWAKAIQQGAFWDLTPFIKDYPSLSKIPQSVYDVTSVNGKLYGIPRARPTDGHESLLIRKDWLDKLGLQPPKTTDDFTKVMEAFTKNDPDGNGKADTYGFASFGSPSPAYYLTSMFNGMAGQTVPMFGFTEETSGQLSPKLSSKATVEGLAYWQKQFKAGYFAPDYPIMKTAQPLEMFIANKVGMVFSNINEPGTKWQDELRKTDPKATVVAYEIPTAPDGKRYYEKSSGSFGILMVNKKVPEAKLKKIMELFDYTSTQEGHLLVTGGIEGVDYTIPNPKLPLLIQPSEAAMKLSSSHSQWIPQYFNKYARAQIGAWSDEQNTAAMALLDSIEKQSEIDPSLGIISPSWNDKSADWSKKINDMYVNVIIGKNSTEDWDKLIKGFQADPAWEKIVNEVNDGYKQRKSK